MPREQRDWQRLVEDILAACQAIRRRTAGMCFESFAGDEHARDAVIAGLRAIGEAASSLPNEVTTRAPQVEWGSIRGLGRMLRQGSTGSAARAVWSMATTTVDQLEDAVRRLRS